MKKLLIAAALAASFAMAAPAAAVTLLTPTCDLTTGCLFEGNDNDPLAIEQAYNAVHAPPPLDLPSLSSEIQAVGEQMTINWSSATPVSYLSVKSGTQFMLYSIANLTAGSISSAGLLGPQGQQQAISHITLFTTGVPEPATWAMMIIGFGMVGAGLRLRREGLARAVA
jgi:hypothetical protein